MSPDDLGWLHYETRRGACVSLRGKIGDLSARLYKLRRPARLTLDGCDEDIGGVERISGADDRRIKWQWWHDSAAARKDGGK